MRIAYLVSEYPKVSHSFIRREILSLEALGFRITRISIRPPEPEYIDEEDESERLKTKSILKTGIYYIFLAILKCLLTRTTCFVKTIIAAWVMGRKSERGLVVHMIYVAEACLLYNWTKSLQIEHIHAHFGTNPAAVALFCHLIGGPGYSFTSHGPEEYDKPQAIGLSTKIKHASFVVAISSFSRSQLFRWCDVHDWQKIEIVHCGVDQKYLREKPTPVPEIKRIVCVGRLCEQKGQQLLVQAAAKVIEAGNKFDLVLVGDGEMRHEIQLLSETLGVEDHIEITGWASGDEVQRQIINSRGLILPSFAEGLPVVIMESFALARPVVSTYVAGIPELVKPTENGWLCIASDVDELVEAIEQILAAPSVDLSRMGANGRREILDNYDSFKEAEKLADTIKKYSK